MTAPPTSAAPVTGSAVRRTGPLVQYALLAGPLLSMLDSSIVNVAVEPIARELHASLTVVQWTVSGYLLALGAGLAGTAYLARRFGTRTVYRASVVAFTVGVKDELPPDGVAAGFDNIGDALSISPLLLEQYLKVARKVSEYAVGVSDPSPVTASRRRTPDDTLPSLKTFINPISPVAPVWVPPQSSVEKSPILITRTRSPYFSPNSAIAL